MEHKLIQGGEQYLPFARSRIKALRAAGLQHASQQFEVDGVSVKVRIAGEHEYIRLEGTSAGYVTSFSSLQYPEVLGTPVEVTANGAKRRIITGTYVAGTHSLLRPTTYPYDSAESSTFFGVSPYSNTYMKITELYSDPANTGSNIKRLQDVSGPSGVMDSTLNHIRVKQFPDDYIYDAPPYGSGDTRRMSDFIPTNISGDHAIIATLEMDLKVSSRNDYSNYAGFYRDAHQIEAVIYSGDTPIGTSPLPPWSPANVDEEHQEMWFDYFWVENSYPIPVGNGITWNRMVSDPKPEWIGLSPSNNTVASGHAGPTFVRVRVLKKNTKAAPSDPDTFNYAEYDVAPLYFFQRAERGPGQTVDTIKAGNRIQPYSYWGKTPDHRAMHALERVASAYDGSVFVVRETSYLEFPLNATQAVVGSCVRGYTLSMVTKAGAVVDGLATGDLNGLGYIDAVVTSADGKSCYVYYGVHNAAESFPEVALYGATFAYPVRFFEFVDKINLDASSGIAIGTKTTIALGPVSHTLSGLPDKVDYDDIDKTHYASPLHGAVAEVKGFIWANRAVLDTKEQALHLLPSYSAHPINADTSAGRPRDTTTGPAQDRCIYVQVGADGKSATYYMSALGIANSYVLTTTGVALKGSVAFDVPRKSIGDSGVGNVITFKKPK